MAVKDGMERRFVSAPAETWTALDELAAEVGRPRFEVFRDVLERGMVAVREDERARNVPLPFTKHELASLRSMYRAAKAKENRG